MRLVTAAQAAKKSNKLAGWLRRVHDDILSAAEQGQMSVNATVLDCQSANVRHLFESRGFIVTKQIQHSAGSSMYEISWEHVNNART